MQKLYQLDIKFIESGVVAVTPEWLHQEAQKLNTDALLYLGMTYFLGEGVVEDHVIALSYFGVAAAFGSEDAVSWKRVMEKLVSNEQLIDAIELAGRCLNSEIKDCE